VSDEPSACYSVRYSFEFRLPAARVVPGIRELIGRAQEALDEVIDTPGSAYLRQHPAGARPRHRAARCRPQVSSAYLETVTTTPELREAFDTDSARSQRFLLIDCHAERRTVARPAGVCRNPECVRAYPGSPGVTSPRPWTPSAAPAPTLMKARPKALRGDRC
jgi:hypothetical protein